MYLTMLAPSDIEFGSKVTEHLKQRKVPFSGSLWIYNAKADEWRLMIATTLVDKLGPTATYQKLQVALRDILHGDAVDLRRLWVVSPKEPLYRALKSVFGKARSVSGMRISQSRVDGIFIDDSYFYEVH